MAASFSVSAVAVAVRSCGNLSFVDGSALVHSKLSTIRHFCPDVWRCSVDIRFILRRLRTFHTWLCLQLPRVATESGIFIFLLLLFFDKSVLILMAK